MTASEGFHKKGGVDGAYVRQERLQENKNTKKDPCVNSEKKRQQYPKTPSCCLTPNRTEKLRTKLHRRRKLFVVAYENESHIVSVHRQRHDDIGLKYLPSLVNDDSLVS